VSDSLYGAAAYPLEQVMCLSISKLKLKGTPGFGAAALAFRLNAYIATKTPPNYNLTAHSGEHDKGSVKCPKCKSPKVEQQ
jgi:hypothetical protein